LAKYRKKPIVVEAVQWFPGVNIEGVIVSPGYGMPPDIQDRVLHGINPEIPKCGAIWTLEGWRLVRPGEWVITGIKGEKYPCKPDIFEATYDPIKE
jgi:hypothetical protein